MKDSLYHVWDLEVGGGDSTIMRVAQKTAGAIDLHDLLLKIAIFFVRIS